MTSTAHPYMANSAPELSEELRAAVGAGDLEELFAQIPADHISAERRSSCRRRSPPRSSSRATCAHARAATSTARRRSASSAAAAGSTTCRRSATRSRPRTEFLTPVWGTPSSDHGRNQAWFEFSSQLGELLELDFVGLPVYSWGCAAGHAIRMAARITGRREVLVPGSIDPERLAVIRTYCEPPGWRATSTSRSSTSIRRPAALDLDGARARALRTHRRGLLREPGYLGVIEPDCERIVALAHAHGAEAIVGVDPISLGVLAPPGEYGADIAVGPTQPLGVHMNCGGGVGGFIATRDEERYAREYPTLQVSLCPTSRRRRARLRADAVRADLLRLARARQRLDRQLGLPVGGRQRRLHVAARARRASTRSAS